MAQNSIASVRIRNRRGMADTDWSQLPYDMISMIANRLNVMEDFLSFSGVCRSWRSVYWRKNWRQACPQLPWLMLPSSSSSSSQENDGNNNNATFYSFLKKKHLQLSLPEASETSRLCGGSACGWLATIGLDYQIHLLNPITRVRINLPPQPTPPNDFFSETNDDDRCLYGDCSIRKLFVFNRSFACDQNQIGGDDDILVLAICGPGSDLAFARPGDDSWVMVATMCIFKFFTLFESHIFAICDQGSLVMVEIGDDYDLSVVHIAGPPNFCWGWDSMYLLESLGDLLLICRYEGRSISDFSSETVSFNVYKFDFGASKYMELADLGDRALFVGDHFSMSLSASEFPNCKSNSIYFTGGAPRMVLEDDKKPPPRGRLDMGVYNVADRSIESFDLGEDFPLLGPHPIWLMPTVSS